MPAYIGSIITILLDLVTVLHIVRSGADRIWIYIVLIFPVVGCVAYFVAEILPDLWSGRDAVVARDRLHTWVDPNRHYRRLSEDAQITDAVGAKAALAGECFRQGRYAEAEAHYRAALTGLHAEDPALLLGLADTLMAARRFNEVPELVARIEISDRNISDRN
ncbi:MAG: tetratricopeptide repeat protein [Alphaproteobacteria bacterium]|nr:tetratricopeptide repeat protein [Alphaproteobacteria bacterium]